MNNLTTTGILSLLDTTKEQRASFVADLVDKLQDGLADPVKVHLQVKKMEDLLNQIKENQDYKNLVMEEAVKYGKKFEMYGAAFEIRSGASRYDYSNDAEHANLKEQLKQREAFLKGLPPEGSKIVTEEGEVVKVYPPNKNPAADIIAVSLK
jgi:hypothetical protein